MKTALPFLLPLLALVMQYAYSSDSPSSSPTIDYAALLEEAKRAYQISFMPNSTRLGQEGNFTDGEIFFAINVTTDNVDEMQPYRFYDYSNCSGNAYGSDVLTGMERNEYTLGNTSDDGYWTFLDSKINIVLEKLPLYEDTSLYSLPNNGELAIISFCAVAGVGLAEVNGVNDTIGFVNLKFNITVNMEQGFSTADVDVEAEYPEEVSQDTTVSYTVDSCVCAQATGNCIASTPVPQNSDITFCISTDVADVGIDAVKSLTMAQNGVQYNAITDSVANSITQSFSMGDKKKVVTTRIPSVFYENVSPLVVSGKTIMKLGNRRKLFSLRHNVHRSLQENDVEGDFSLDLELKSDEGDKEDSNASNKNFLSSIFTMAIGLAICNVIL